MATVDTVNSEGSQKPPPSANPGIGGREEAEQLLQTNRREYIENEWLRGPWVTVCSLRGPLDDYLSINCALVAKNRRSTFFDDVGREFRFGDGVPCVYTNGGSSRAYYSPLGFHQGIEPLVIRRTFYNEWEAYFELTQEFRLYFNLNYDEHRQVYLHCDPDGEEHEVARVDRDEVHLKLPFIIKFLGLKQIHLGLFFQGISSSVHTLEALGLSNTPVEVKRDRLRYELACRDYEHGCGGEHKAFSRLMGKAVIECQDRSVAAALKKRQKEKYCSFIIGMDEAGLPVIHSCDPGTLANYFGKNPDAPHYLTPVFFRREVLQKYYDNPKQYSVEDGSIRRAALWSMRIDNDHHRFVIAWLGDLGRDLSEKERNHWLQFNVQPDGGISRTSYTRNIRGWFANPEMPDLIVKHLYEHVNQQWSTYWGWPIFKPWRKNDEHLFKSLRVPLTDNQLEFDTQILTLTKLLIDSLNEQAIQRTLTDLEPQDKGITKLQKWFLAQNCSGFEGHIQFLRSLQEIRAGSAHRKGSKHEKAMNALNMENLSLPARGRRLFECARDFLEYLASLLPNKQSVPSPAALTIE
jgi:hypothetical protein